MLHEELALDLPPNSDAAVGGAGEEEGQGGGGRWTKKLAQRGGRNGQIPAKKKKKAIETVLYWIFSRENLLVRLSARPVER